MSALGTIIDIIQQKKSSGVLGRTIFFRGQRTNQSLVPSLIRNVPKYHTDLFKAENNFFCDAWIMAANEISEGISSWEALALFQHYQIPTRLLDWSSSLVNALYFSISKCLSCEKMLKNTKCDRVNKVCSGNPVIWVLDPAKMHKHLFPSDPDINQLTAITIGIDEIQDYKKCFVTLKESWKLSNGPIFMEIPWRNKRILSQKGYFTFHPSDIPLENQLSETCGLVKIEISKRDRSKIIKEFDILGINEHDVYADLPSLGSYFERKFRK